MTTKRNDTLKCTTQQRPIYVRADAETHRLLKGMAFTEGTTMRKLLAQLVAAAAKNRRPALSHE